MEGCDRSNISQVGNDEVRLGQINVHNSREQLEQRFRRSNQQRHRRQIANSSQRAQNSMQRYANYQTRLTL
ncbi:hypothetical protein C1H46_045466 [Malus baccata]|uniref:Uncharacterized protein n=1 Tax=Malus baccata TaxID=106549 RepID=A0A540K445_MALBA|nr:hypothetical protein C1H46_045466 [Malus baccata]